MKYKDFYALICSKQQQLENHGLENNYGTSYHIARNWLADISNKSFINKALRAQAVDYLTNGSTIKLRELLRAVGCDYWQNIKHQNACDLIDSLR